MQKLIAKYGLAAHLAFLAVAPLFLSPVCVLWLCLLGATWLLMEPSRYGDEMAHDARNRLLRCMVRDPLFWVLAGVVAFEAFRCLNDGVAMAYDAENGKWFLRGPAVSWFPGSTMIAGGQEFAASLALLVVVTGCRLALGKFARQSFLVMLSFFTGVLGLVLACLHYDGSSVVKAMSTFELHAAIHPGVAFGLGFLATIASTMSSFELAWRKTHAILLPALVGNAAGLVIFSPAWTVALFLVGGAILFAYGFVYAKIRMSGNVELKFVVAVTVGIVIAGFVAGGALTEKLLVEKAETIRRGDVFTEEYLAARSTVSAVSRRAWQAHPWVGNGLGSFSCVMRFFAADEDWASVPSDQNRALNGYWQLLAEGGIVNALVVLSVAVLLLVSYLRGLITGVRHGLPMPSAWLGLVSFAAVLVQMAFDCSVFYPGVAVLTTSLLAISANSFSKEISNV